MKRLLHGIVHFLDRAPVSLVFFICAFGCFLVIQEQLTLTQFDEAAVVLASFILSRALVQLQTERFGVALCVISLILFVLGCLLWYQSGKEIPQWYKPAGFLVVMLSGAVLPAYSCSSLAKWMSQQKIA